MSAIEKTTHTIPTSPAVGRAENSPDAANNPSEKPKKLLTIHDLGWTKEQAAEVRALFACIAEDWDDPEMDIYNDLWR